MLATWNAYPITLVCFETMWYAWVGTLYCLASMWHALLYMHFLICDMHFCAFALVPKSNFIMLNVRWSTVEYQEVFSDPKMLVFGVIRSWATWISLQPRCYVLRSWEMPFRCRDKSQRLEPRRSWMDLAHFAYSKHEYQYMRPDLVYTWSVVWIIHKRNRASEWPFEEITWSMVNNVTHDNDMYRQNASYPT